MTDPFELRTTAQRAIVLAAVLAYFVLFAADTATNTPTAGALADVVVAALAVPASLVVARRAIAAEPTDLIALIAAIAFFVAGVGIGYGGIAALREWPTVLVLDAVGSLALLIALALYLYHTYQ